eukprot:gene738-1205_t
MKGGRNTLKGRRKKFMGGTLPVVYPSKTKVSSSTWEFGTKSMAGKGHQHRHIVNMAGVGMPPLCHGARVGTEVPTVAVRLWAPKDHAIVWPSTLIHRAAENTSEEIRRIVFMYVRRQNSANMVKENISFPAAGLPAPQEWRVADYPGMRLTLRKPVATNPAERWGVEVGAAPSKLDLGILDAKFKAWASHQERLQALRAEELERKLLQTVESVLQRSDKTETDVLERVMDDVADLRNVAATKEDIQRGLEVAQELQAMHGNLRSEFQQFVESRSKAMDLLRCIEEKLRTVTTEIREGVMLDLQGAVEGLTQQVCGGMFLIADATTSAATESLQQQITQLTAALSEMQTGLGATMAAFQGMQLRMNHDVQGR